MIFADILRPAAAVLWLLAVSASASHGETRHMEGAGSSLAIASPCARSVTIQPDPALTDRVVIDATAEHPEETAELVLDNGGNLRLHGPRNTCWEPASESDFDPTMTIAIRVPAAMALTIDESGGAEYTLGDLHGPLTLDISGGVKLRAGSAGALTLDLSGGADIGVGRLDGTAKGELSGGGSVRIGQAALQDLTIELSGGGDVHIGSGQISRATIAISGSASVQIGAVVGDATVDLSGVGSVRFAKVTGRLNKTVDGIGTVSVDSQ